MKPLFALVGLLVCAGSGWTVYQSSLDAVGAGAADTAAEESPSVRVERAARDVVEQRIELIGSLEPRSTVEIRAAVPGYITKMPVDLGDSVDAGSVIVELDAAAAREIVTSSEAALRVAGARLKAQEATAAHARSELERWEKLASSGVSTGQQLDAAKAQVAVADSQVELERAQVEQMKAELDQARLQLGQTLVRAPESGFVAARLVSIGHLASPDLPLLRLVSIATVRTVVHVPEQDYVRIQVGQTAEITVDALPDRSFEGRVVRKAPVLDPMTRTAAVEIEIPNPDFVLKPGMHAGVTITFDTHPATVVPMAALREDAAGRAVFVVSGTPPTARRVPVVAGVFGDGRVEILKGVTEKDWVVTLGHDGLESGSVVQPIRDEKGERLVAEESRASSDRDAPTP